MTRIIITTTTTALMLLAACAPDNTADYATTPASREALAAARAGKSVEQVRAEDVAAKAKAEADAIELERQSQEAARWLRIEETRRKDPALNWAKVGITTGKFSESISSGVYRTYDECVSAFYSEDNVCIPITALPQSYWDAEKTQ